MMHRHSSRSRSRARELESRQPQEDGRQWPVAPPSNTTPASHTNNVPRTPLQPQHPPTSPHSAPNFTKTRCYRLNLEKPFDIRQSKSPLGRDYTGPPVLESDLPPAQGPVEYIPPLHLCSREEIAHHRHSWGGNNGGYNPMVPPTDLLENLHVSISEESDRNVDPTTIAISTANIFRGIVVDRNGVITSMNSRAMRSMKGKNGAGGSAGGENKVKIGEKSRQAAKIDKAKDLIDVVTENGGGDAMSDEENDPTKTVSLIVMGEYEDLNDLVRDGSKKLRNSKTMSDEAILMYNRPRQSYPPHPQHHQPQPLTMSKMVLSSGNSQYSGVNTEVMSMYGSGDPAMSPTNTSSSGGGGPASQFRKLICSPDKGRSTYKQVPVSSTPPKLKSNPRDTRSAGNGGSSRGAAGRRSSNVGSPNTTTPTTSGYHYGCNPLGSHNNDNKSQSSQQPQQQQAYPNYFQQQCNFFPGNSDWTEALGFSVNSLWNCGANGENLSPTMSPNSNPSSPRNGGSSLGPGHVQGAAPTTVGGGVMYHHHAQGQPSSQYPTTTNSGYYHHHHPSSSNGYHYRPESSSAAGAGGAGGYANTNGYNYNATYRNEERNPSYGYGNRGGNSPGVRDTVVM